MIGDPVAHSLSPLLHNTAFAELGLDWVSVGFPVAAGIAPRRRWPAPGALGMRGLSVTMPHKDAAAAVVDRLIAAGRAAGCGQLRGPSTTGPCRVTTPTAPGWWPRSAAATASTRPGERCLVIGAGGAARAVIAALADAGAAEVVVVNRIPDRAASAAALAGPVGRVGRPGGRHRCDLVVNATPLGMAATGGKPPSTVADRSRRCSPRARWWWTSCTTRRSPPGSRRARDRGAAVSNGARDARPPGRPAAGPVDRAVDPPVEAMWRAVHELPEADRRSARCRSGRRAAG